MVRKDNATRWVSAQKQIFFGKDEMGKLVPKTGIVLLRETTADKKSAEHIRVLMLEVNHRSNNLLSVVSAMARQTATMAEPTKFVSHLTDRIAGLAVTQNLLVNSKWGGVDIFELLMAHLSLFGNEFGKRVTLKGPKISVNPAAMQLMGMAVHELSTNAALFGALSNDNGTISVNWEALKKPIAEFQITWRERGGPSVNKSSHKGFGHRVIVEIIEAGVNGKVHLNQLATGLVWQLVAPLAQITETK